MDNLITKTKQQLKSNPAIQNAVNWYEHLAPRDQKVVKGLSLVITLALVFSWVWAPSVSSKHKAEKRFESALSFHEKMKSNAHYFSGSAQKIASNNGSILSIVNNTAKAKGVQLKRFEPDGNGGLRIWLDKVSFDSSIDWLELLEKEKGLKVEQISLDKVKSGIVNIRATLTP
jgi:general secretion pathway protein M